VLQKSCSRAAASLRVRTSPASIVRALDGFAVKLGERREQNDLAMILSKGVASCQPQ
jgi:hypothetical protein